MSAALTNMREFIEAAQLRVPRDIHPMSLAFIHENFCAMRDAADDPRRVMQLLAKVGQRIARELRWEAVKSASVRDFKEAYKLRRRAGKFLRPPMVDVIDHTSLVAQVLLP